jgi:DNA repair exonuclease SbcCD ATPase subunit
VAIEGFLSYRNRIEFSFDGAPIWMLTGKNGAGKSSVFDAITFALYGVHRGGKDDAKELINRGCDRLAVEFDFLLGEDCYRVQRTVARKGGPTFQATHLSGPNSPNRKRTGVQQPISGTDSKTGLTKWVERKLGLDSKAFKMSVLLEQGKSDALLSAEPKERHALLSQLVDLSRYVALEAAAKKRLGEENQTVERNKAELALLPEVTPAQIVTQEQRVTEAKTQIDLARQRLEQLQALMVHAARWNDLSRQRDSVCATLEKMRALLTDERSIECAALRLADLQMTLPSLQRILQYRQNQRRYQGEAETYSQNVAALAAKVVETTPLWEQAQRCVMQLQDARDAAQRAENSALLRLHELSTAIHCLDEMARLREQLASCDEQLATFALDLDQQVAAAQNDVEACILLKTILPYTQQYTRARETWRTASAQLAEALQRQEDDAHLVIQAVADIDVARSALVQANEAAGHAQSQWAVADRDRQEAEAQLQKFEEVGAQPSCPYCGQVLSREHIVAERARLEEKLAHAVTVAKAARDALTVARKNASAAETGLRACQNELEHVQKQQRESQSHCESLAKECRRAESDGRYALEKLRQNSAPMLALPNANDPAPNDNNIIYCFAQPEPTAHDLDLLNARVQGMGAAQRALKELQSQSAARERYRTSRQQVESQYQPLAVSYPAARAEAIRSEYASIEGEKVAAQSSVARLAPQLDDAKHNLQSLEMTLQDVNARQQAAEQGLHTAQRMALESQAQWQQEIDALSATWQDVARQVDQEQIASLQGEIVSLAGADVRFEELHTARSQITLVVARLAEIEGDLAVIPPEAQQDVEALQHEETQARTRQAAGEAEHALAANELSALHTRRQRIKELATATRAAEKKATHYKLIAKYLGSDYLQRFLLQQAEKAIVEQANEVLDHCSGGALSMELRPHPQEGGVQKAFDLMVENHDTQSIQAKMLPAWLLSGSQRFRVAISLALAIGQYASSNGQGMESVIIDEGFGTLDRQGLRDMERALRGLDGMIKRIILVSHQDDFASAFPHRYAVRLEDGASRAELENGLEAAL